MLMLWVLALCCLISRCQQMPSVKMETVCFSETQKNIIIFVITVKTSNVTWMDKFQRILTLALDVEFVLTMNIVSLFASRGLLSSVQHCAEWVSSTDKQEPIQKCFRSLEYIFKFIIQSRLLFSRATGGQYEDSFKKDLYSVFTALNKMLATSSDVILPTQVYWHNRLFLFYFLVDLMTFYELLWHVLRFCCSMCLNCLAELSPPPTHTHTNNNMLCISIFTFFVMPFCKPFATLPELFKYSDSFPHYGWGIWKFVRHRKQTLSLMITLGKKLKALLMDAIGFW